MRASSFAAVVAFLALPWPELLSHAYTGGPIRAEIAGVELVERRVYYRLVFHDEAGTPPQVYYFDLDGAKPATALRAQDLEWKARTNRLLKNS